MTPPPIDNTPGGRGRLLHSMTDSERLACRIAYKQHIAACKKYDITPASWPVFAWEWIDVLHREENPGMPASEDYEPARDYNRAYLGTSVGADYATGSGSKPKDRARHLTKTIDPNDYEE